jgi:hypothetical protein
MRQKNDVTKLAPEKRRLKKAVKMTFKGLPRPFFEAIYWYSGVAV